MPPPRWVSGRRALVVAAAVVAVLAAAGALLWQAQQRLDDRAAAAARAFAEGAEKADLSGVRLAEGDAAAYEAVTKGLAGATPDVRVARVRRDGDTGVAELRWTWPFGPDGWTYRTQLPLLAGSGDRWAVRWSPDAVHPQLQEGDRLDAERTAPPRGQVLGRDGSPLVRDTPVVEVGVQPSRAKDPAALARTLAGLLEVEAGALEKRIRAASPNAFVSVIVLRRSDYDPLRSRLQPLPGTVFRESTRPLAPTRAFARALLGTAGPATAEAVQASRGRLAAGDVAGLSGLQRTYDDRLGGTAGVRVDLVRGQDRQELYAVPPVPGQSVQVTLDATVQQAADAALAAAKGGNGNASLVALDVATGDVVAVANTPVTGGDRALSGRYPPGSTFKTATTVALLGDGLTPAETVGCPATASADGRSFRNFEGGALGQIPFRTAFAQSCNTAFVTLSERLEPGDLVEAGQALGLGSPWQVGADVFPGEVPPPSSAVDEAATAIGQGKVLASPAAMAQVAATLARGSWKAPRLVLDPAPAGDAPAAPPAADPARLATVRELMRQVVLDGTATELRDVPGGPVHAKTGTAEFGTESPPRTHAWTIGFQGGLAFAVLVEEGSSGGAVAVPVAEAFLRGL